MPADPRTRLKDLLSVLPTPGRTAARAARALVRPETPLLTQLVVTRRCNLSCGYCNEYDDHSPPVPKETLFERSTTSPSSAT